MTGRTAPLAASWRQAVCTVFAGLFLLTAGSPAGATTVLRLADEALVDQADRIVHGRVIAKVVHALPDRTCYTEYRIRVTEVLKGDAPAAPAAELTFREWGGKTDAGWGYWIPGTGELDLDQEVVVFLGRPDPATGVGFTTGLAQGKFQVRRKAGREAEVLRDLEGLELLDDDGRPVAPRAAPERRRLEDLKRRVRARVEAGKR